MAQSPCSHTLKHDCLKELSPKYGSFVLIDISYDNYYNENDEFVETCYQIYVYRISQNTFCLSVENHITEHFYASMNRKGISERKQNRKYHSNNILDIFRELDKYIPKRGSVNNLIINEEGIDADDDYIMEKISWLIIKFAK